MKNRCHVPLGSVPSWLQSCHLQALVQAVDSSAEGTEPAKPGRGEQVRENTARRSQMLVGAAERLIFKKKRMGLLFPSCCDL